MADFVKICKVCARKAIIEAAKRIINSDKVCHSYSDLNFGVTFFGTQCRIRHFQTKNSVIFWGEDSPPPRRNRSSIHLTMTPRQSFTLHAAEVIIIIIIIRFVKRQNVKRLPW